MVYDYLVTDDVMGTSPRNVKKKVSLEIEQQDTQLHGPIEEN